MFRLYGISLILFMSYSIGYTQEIRPIWSGDIPNYQAIGDTESIDRGNILWIQNVQEPTLEIYLPTERNATGQAVVICPGGAYFGLAYDWEGTDFAKWFNSKGIAAFVLKYRLPTSTSVVTKHLAPLQDAQRAIRMVRQNADDWFIAKDQIGIMGFSAGGHLASTLGTHFEEDLLLSSDPMDALSARPDFMILVYPVITMDSSYTHGFSQTNLLGENPEPAMIEHFSNELQVTEDTPPTFLVHASDDDAVPVMNSLLFYQALQKKGVETEMHIYPSGGHGFAFGLEQDGYLRTWVNRLYDWLGSLD